MASNIARGEKVCAKLWGLSSSKMSESKHRFISATTYSREAMGGHKYEFCAWFSKDTKRA